jgi:hypothetical protein
MQQGTIARTEPVSFFSQGHVRKVKPNLALSIDERENVA